MTKKPVPSLADVPVTAPAEGAPEAGPALAVMQPDKPRRESLHVRIPAETVERLREASHRTRREKQEIADEALREWLSRHSF